MNNSIARWLPAAVAIGSGLLLAAAFPPLEWSELAWIGLAPLLLVTWRATPRQRFSLGWWCGMIFWSCTLFWLTEVTWPGWVLLSAYCALFFAGFAVTAGWLHDQWDGARLVVRIGWMLALPLGWVGLEFMRATWFTGFAWNPLGGSQFEVVSLIQMAAWTGVYGVSAVVMLVNVAVALTVDRYIREGLRSHRAWHPELMLAFLVLAISMTRGGRHMRLGDEPTTQLRVAVIQPNIPQYQKWTPEFVDHIYDQLASLTSMALQVGDPDLVIWPETAVPDYVRQSRRSYGLVRELTTMGAPLLVGSMDVEWVDEGKPRHFNSSLLFNRDGVLVESYDKQHLVMFGEYVPLSRFLPFMTAMTPIEASFDAGSESTAFVLDEPEVRFAVLICFEDTVARLARRAVRQGARLLINQTNDAWFRESSAARQHMTHSVFRAVENQVPVVRAANTGVSCGIDRHGRIHNVLADETGNTFVSGFQMMSVQTPAGEQVPTFYARHGDWLGWSGKVLLLMVALAAGMQRGWWKRKGVRNND